VSIPLILRPDQDQLVEILASDPGPSLPLGDGDDQGDEE
jgi:hypothetical protein